MSDSFEIVPIACRRDNYAYAIVDRRAQSAWIVDPSEALPVRNWLDARGLKLTHILLTHHHHDHVDGIGELVGKEPGSVEVWAHERDAARIAGLTHTVAVGTDAFYPTALRFGEMAVEACHVPGHTLGAVAWKIGADVFTGDTLFSAGCGRLFEGSYAQLHTSLRRICGLSPATRLWFGHEYTRGILEWRLRHVADDEACKAYLSDLAEVTTPSTVAREWEINAFVRAPDVEAFTALRKLKDLG